MVSGSGYRRRRSSSHSSRFLSGTASKLFVFISFDFSKLDKGTVLELMPVIRGYYYLINYPAFKEKSHWGAQKSAEDNL
jgi:hypothetical protein